MMWSVKILTTLQAIVCLGSSLQTNLTNPKGPLTQKHQTDSSAGDKSDHFLLYDRVENRQSDDTHSVLWRGISVRKEAAMLGEHLRELANNELGVTMIQSIFDSLGYEAKDFNTRAQTKKIAKGIELKLTSYKRALLANKALIDNLYQFHKRSAMSHSISCCDHILSYSSTLQAVNFTARNVCDLLPADVKPGVFNPGRNLSSFIQNRSRYPSIKSQYFISCDGTHNELPALSAAAPNSVYTCAYLQSYRHRSVYAETVSSTPRQVVIVVDISMALSDNQLKTGKELAKQALDSLSQNDRVFVMSLSGVVGTASSFCTEAGALMAITPASRQLLSFYIDQLDRSQSLANHTLGMERVFSVFSPGDTADTILLYISRGLMNSITEARDVLAIISNGNTALNGIVTINTYTLTDQYKQSVYGETFLEDVARQNFSKYNIDYSGPDIKVGETYTVCSPDSVSSSLISLLSPRTSATDHTSESSDRVVYSSLYADLLDHDAVLSMSSVCNDEDGRVIGVVGLDLRPEELFDSVINSNDDHSLAFVIDLHGLVVTHPLLSNTFKPATLLLSSTHITELENYHGIHQVVEIILGASEGAAELALQQTNVTDGMTGYKYTWYRVAETPYIVVLRTDISCNTQKLIKSVDGVDDAGIVYHRLDLGQLPSAVTCLHFLQLASFSTSAVFLSPRAFESAYDHVSQTETRTMVQNYMAYIGDSSSYVSKPGLKDGVKDDVLALSKINRQWLALWKTSRYSNFIIRRYISTAGGVYRMFPATLMSKLYDPARTLWYRQASSLPGRISLTRPYIDSAGAGLIVTLSHSIYEGRSAALHSSRDPVSAVVAADLPMTYFQRMLLTRVPSCSKRTFRCFILDDRGYLVAHTGTPVSSYHESREQLHVTHVEPVIAHDILGHEHLVRKKLCRSYSGEPSIQRYYQFNTSHTGTITNLKAGEQCLKYQLSLIPGTNVFLVVVNETCDVIVQAFCPCSILDRRCLNCHRMEQTECECPCECRLNQALCLPDDPPREEDEMCEVYSESDILHKLPDDVTQKVAQCLEPQCDQFHTELACMGVMGCSWCSVELDGKTPLDKGYCAIQQLCFGGIIGARTPYNDQIARFRGSDELPNNTLLKNTPVGPVTGAILGLLVLIALSVYCYRHGRRGGPQSSASSVSQCNANPASTDHNNYVYHELPAVPGPSNAAAHLQVAGNMNVPEMEVAALSPYRINVNYRPPRPPVTTTESSDHGYSTMTVHDEADNQSTSCVESVSSSKSRGFLSKPKTSLKLLYSVRPSRKDPTGESDSCQLLSSTDRDGLHSLSTPLPSLLTAPAPQTVLNHDSQTITVAD